jgi:hypothetical protein
MLDKLMHILREVIYPVRRREPEESVSHGKEVLQENLPSSFCCSVIWPVRWPAPIEDLPFATGLTARMKKRI